MNDFLTKLLPFLNGKTNPLVIVLLALISAGGVSHIFGMWELSWEREDSFITKYKDELKEHAITRKKLYQCGADLSILNGSIIEVPFPFWIKNLDSKVIYLNHEYEDLILRPLRLDKTDVLNTLGEKMGSDKNIADWISNDQLVIRTGVTQKVEESVNDVKGISYKYPIYKNNRVVLLGGIFIPN